MKKLITFTYICLFAWSGIVAGEALEAFEITKGKSFQYEESSPLKVRFLIDNQSGQPLSEVLLGTDLEGVLSKPLPENPLGSVLLHETTLDGIENIIEVIDSSGLKTRTFVFFDKDQNIHKLTPCNELKTSDLFGFVGIVIEGCPDPRPDRHLIRLMRSGLQHYFSFCGGTCKWEEEEDTLILAEKFINCTRSQGSYQFYEDLVKDEGIQFFNVEEAEEAHERLSGEKINLFWPDWLDEGERRHNSYFFVIEKEDVLLTGILEGDPENQFVLDTADSVKKPFLIPNPVLKSFIAERTDLRPYRLVRDENAVLPKGFIKSRVKGDNQNFWTVRQRSFFNEKNPDINKFVRNVLRVKGLFSESSGTGRAKSWFKEGTAWEHQLFEHAQQYEPHNDNGGWSYLDSGGYSYDCGCHFPVPSD